MCEPLRGKKESALLQKFYWEKDVKSAVEFYKKWKGKNPMMLTEFVFLDYRDWIRTKTKNKIQEKILMEDFPIDDDWLFDYCFGDVIE